LIVNQTASAIKVEIWEKFLKAVSLICTDAILWLTHQKLD